jgi:hypothetical protein
VLSSEYKMSPTSSYLNAWFLVGGAILGGSETLGEGI